MATALKERHGTTARCWRYDIEEIEEAQSVSLIMLLLFLRCFSGCECVRNQECLDAHIFKKHEQLTFLLNVDLRSVERRSTFC